MTHKYLFMYHLCAFMVIYVAPQADIALYLISVNIQVGVKL